MRYLTFAAETNRYPVAVLTKVLRKLELGAYVAGIETEAVAYGLPSTPKPKNDEIKACLAHLLPTLCGLEVDYVIVTDAAYFKVLTKVARTDRFYGYVLPCVLEGYEHLHVLYAPSPNQIMYDPIQRTKVQQALHALQAHRAGNYAPPGSSIVHFSAFPDTVEDIAHWLDKLLDVPLAIDIETYSLRHYDAGIGSITLCWSQHEGIAFCVDKDNDPAKCTAIRALLKQFFLRRTARTLYHRAWFDVYVLVYQLFMRDTLDTDGLLHGLEVMLRNFEDTQLVRYLATNTCAGNELSLKDVTQEFVGNYAIDVQDIRAVPKQTLLEYNLTDGLATWYAYNKHWQQMVDDQQLGIYQDLFKPAVADIIQMQLTGLPLDMAEVQRGKALMQATSDTAVNAILAMPEVAEFTRRRKLAYVAEMNTTWKKKRITFDEVGPIDAVTLNLNSPDKLQELLYEVMGLPIISVTKTKQPSTDGDTIEALIHHAQDPSHKALLQHLIDFKEVDKILTSFIPAFEAAHLAPDGWHYLHGFFNLGGTLSGRLSSSEPNLQNLPATGSKFAKVVKKMFKAPPGKHLVGLDFSSLEDRISALTTKDPNKLKVYTDGYDGHSLRAFFYFREQMPDIEDTVVSINSIQVKYKSLRQDSKAPTFALTYQGTWSTLVKNCGFTREKAEMIENRYHEMYVVSDRWVQAKLAEAAQVGYVTVAFGLRLRTPMMHQTVMGIRVTPREAAAEGRTAGNALGQSYCMLNTRAGSEFLQKVRTSTYRLKIRPCAQIHDAQYYLVDDDIQTIAWMNVHLVQAVQWQALPEIQHADVKLGGELSVFYPTWNDEFTIPNGADADQILHLAREHIHHAAAK